MKNRWFYTALLACYVLLSASLVSYLVWEKGKYVLTAAERRLLAQAEEIILAGDAAYPPFSFTDIYGQHSGYEADLVKALEVWLGRPMKYRQLAWADALEALAAGRVTGITGMRVTPERARIFTFTKPYWQTVFALVCAIEKDPLEILAQPAFTVAVQEGSATHNYFHQHYYQEGTTYIFLTDPVEALSMLLQGRADLWIENYQVARYEASRLGLSHHFFSFHPLPGSEGGYALALGPRYGHLAPLFNKALASLEAQGVLSMLDQKWFGLEGKRLVPSPYRTVIPAVLLVVLTMVIFFVFWNRLLQEKVEQKTEEHRLLLDNIAVHVWYLYDPQTYGMVNAAHAAFFGRLPGEMHGKKLKALFLRPEERESLEQHNREAFEQGLATTREELLHNQRGDPRLFLVSRNPILREGRVAYLVCTGVDITVQKEVAEALQESEAKFRYIAEFSPLPIALISPDGRYEYVNPMFEKVFGYTLAEIPTGKRWFELAYPDPLYRRMVIQAWVNDLKELGQDVVRPRSFRVACQDGTEKEILFLPVLMANGKHLLMSMDITEKLQSERELQFQRSYFETLFAHSPDAVVYMDAEDNIKAINESFTRVFGYTPEACVGKNIDLLLAGEGALEQAQEITREVRAGKPQSIEAVRYRKDGSPVEVSIKAIPLLINGVYEGGFGIYSDISERKQAERTIAAYNLELEALNRQLEEEISKARYVHGRLLAAQLPEIEGYSVAAHYQPAREIGGDFFDVIRRQDKLVFYLSDVSGHGLDSAMLSGFVKHTVNTYLALCTEKEIRPERIVRFLAEQYARENYPDDYFICVFMAVLDLKNHLLSCCSAGFHNPPLLCAAGGGEPVELLCRGLPIASTTLHGLQDLPAEQLTLPPGTTLIFYSDGLVEQESGGRYYLERLKDVFSRHSNLPPELIARAINEDFRAFNHNSQQGDDDITFLVLKREGERKVIHRLELESSYRALEEFQRETLAYLTLNGLPEREHCLVGLYELVANAMEHGNRFAPAKKVTVEIGLLEDYLFVTVEDEGEGFDWRGKIDLPLGLGGVGRGDGAFPLPGFAVRASFITKKATGPSSICP